MSKFAAFFDELEKVAFGPEAMGKVLSRFKQIQIKNPVIDQYMGGIGGKKGLQQAMGAARRSGVPDEIIEAAKPATEDFMKNMRPHGPTVFAPRAGDTVNFLQKHEIPEMMENADSFHQVAANPGHRRALDAVMKGHELAETQVAPNNSFMGFGHRSPDVILREHNMIQTLPEDQAPVGEVLRGMRALGEAPALKQTTGFEYGQGPRISRHARKHISRLHEEEAVRMAKEQGLL